MVTDYVSNMIYIDDNLEMVMTEEGRMVPTEASAYRAEYFLKDHLGNSRVSFTDTDDDGDADIIQEDHFYPYGMTMGDLSYVSGTKNDFMYQGKEQQDELNLYWYDFGVRMFDEQLGRWHVPDPMNQYVSPYVGMGNRPSSMVDPDGMWASGGSNRWAVMQDFLNGMMHVAAQQEAWNEYLNSNSGIQYDKESTMGELFPELVGLNEDGGIRGGGTPDEDEMEMEYISDDIMVISFKKFGPGTEGSGVNIELEYIDQGSNLTDLEWLQTVEDNDPTENESSQYVDDETGDPPFYYTDQENDYYTGIRQMDHYFVDTPARDHTEGNHWKAELSIVGRNGNGKYERITTVNYGFYIKNRTLHLIKPHVINNPSSFHINSIPEL